MNIQAIGAESGVLVSQPAVSRLQMYRNQLTHTFQGFSFERLRSELRKPRTWGVLGCGAVIVGVGCYILWPRVKAKKTLSNSITPVNEQPKSTLTPRRDVSVNSSAVPLQESSSGNLDKKDNIPHELKKVPDIEIKRQEEHQTAWDFLQAVEEDGGLKDSCIRVMAAARGSDQKILDMLTVTAKALDKREHQLVVWAAEAFETLTIPFEYECFDPAGKSSHEAQLLAQEKAQIQTLLGRLLYGVDGNGNSMQAICQAIVSNYEQTPKKSVVVCEWVQKLKKSLDLAVVHAIRPNHPEDLFTVPPQENKVSNAEQEKRKAAFDEAYRAINAVHESGGLQQACNALLKESVCSKENNVVKALVAYDSTLALEAVKLIIRLSDVLGVLSKPFELGCFNDDKNSQAKKDFQEMLGNIWNGLIKQDQSMQQIGEAIIADHQRICYVKDDSKDSKEDPTAQQHVEKRIMRLKRNFEAAKKYAVNPAEPRLLLGREARNELDLRSSSNPTPQTDGGSSDTDQQPAEDVLS